MQLVAHDDGAAKQLRRCMYTLNARMNFLACATCRLLFPTELLPQSFAGESTLEVSSLHDVNCCSQRSCYQRAVAVQESHACTFNTLTNCLLRDT